MYLSKPSAQTRTRIRVRATLWLACAVALALPAWLAVTYWLIGGSLAQGAALAPVGAYVGWRIVSELTDENDVGVSALDRIWIQVERHLPNAGVRRVAWRTVRSVVAMGAIAGVMLIGFQFFPKREAPEALAPAVVSGPAAEPEVIIEPRQITGLFATKVEMFPRMVWPAYGSLAAFYGPDSPMGIEIYVGGEASVMASARGSVVYAGPDVCCGYGYTVVVEHDDGWVTTYGRLGYITVRQNDRVKAGETIGNGGAPPGEAKRVQFQVQRNGRSYDPLTVLPASQMGQPVLPATNQMCGDDAIALDANSVVNLALTSTALQRYELENAAVTSNADGAPNIDAGLVGLLSIVMQVPPTTESSYVLHLMLHKPDDRITLDCPLTVRNAADVPLSVAPVVRYAPIITPTPFGGPPTPTPFPSPTPAVTPTPAPAGIAPAVESRPAPAPFPSPTPFGAVLRMVSTPTPAPRIATPSKNQASKPKTPVATPTPFKGPTQYFPRQYRNIGGVNVTPAPSAEP
jgi:hypothetical protein